jgi:enamine deaminase RidA (YjgF/YER057c/UK114 family)
MLKLIAEGGISCSRFRTRAGDTEHYVAISASCGPGFQEQLAQVRERYEEARKSLGLGPESAIFRRLFVSDAVNQGAAACASELVAGDDDSPVAVSIVEQPPLPGSKIALLAYHVKSRDSVRKRRLSANHVLVERGARRQLWSTRLCAATSQPAPGSGMQTRRVFAHLTGALDALGGNLADHCVRTWIYVKGIDTFYQGMVESRRELLAREGLTGSTHYIASTGIEGASAHRGDVVMLDAYSILDLKPAQVSYLNDFTRLCATKDYGVTFERGTRVAYADRAHCLISGTASIDHRGRVVHAGDVRRQLDRAIDNVKALLRAGKAGIEDLMHLIVYLRDPTDYWLVNGRLREQFGTIPIVIVKAAVCRPEWLVEIEGVAVTPNDEPALPAF